MYFIDRALATFLSQLAGDPQTFPDDGVKRAELQKFKPAVWYGRAVGGASLHRTANCPSCPLTFVCPACQRFHPSACTVGL